MKEKEEIKQAENKELNTERSDLTFSEKEREEIENEVYSTMYPNFERYASRVQGQQQNTLIQKINKLFDYVRDTEPKKRNVDDLLDIAEQEFPEEEGYLRDEVRHQKYLNSKVSIIYLSPALSLNVEHLEDAYYKDMYKEDDIHHWLKNSKRVTLNNSITGEKIEVLDSYTIDKRESKQPNMARTATNVCAISSGNQKALKDENLEFEYSVRSQNKIEKKLMPLQALLNEMTWVNGYTKEGIIKILNYKIEQQKALKKSGRQRDNVGSQLDMIYACAPDVIRADGDVLEKIAELMSLQNHTKFLYTPIENRVSKQVQSLLKLKNMMEADKLDTLIKSETVLKYYNQYISNIETAIKNKDYKKLNEISRVADMQSDYLAAGFEINIQMLKHDILAQNNKINYFTKIADEDMKYLSNHENEAFFGKVITEAAIFDIPKIFTNINSFSAQYNQALALKEQLQQEVREQTIMQKEYIKVNQSLKEELENTAKLWKEKAIQDEKDKRESVLPDAQLQWQEEIDENTIPLQKQDTLPKEQAPTPASEVDTSREETLQAAEKQMEEPNQMIPGVDGRNIVIDNPNYNENQENKNVAMAQRQAQAQQASMRKRQICISKNAIERANGEVAEYDKNKKIDYVKFPKKSVKQQSTIKSQGKLEDSYFILPEKYKKKETEKAFVYEFPADYVGFGICVEPESRKPYANFEMNMNQIKKVFDFWPDKPNPHNTGKTANGRKQMARQNRTQYHKMHPKWQEDPRK